jgi:DNA gyrase subunit A
VNLLNFAEGEKVADCRAVRDFHLPDHYLMMATLSGLVKKTALEKFSRPMRGGIIAIKLREDDEVVDVVITKPGDEVVLATAKGMAIRFNEADARPMGRNTSGVKGITLVGDDSLVGMVVAEPDATLLTACLHGYGKRTPFGPNSAQADAEGAPPAADDETDDDTSAAESAGGSEEGEAEESTSSSARYRAQRRGGKGLRDIKTTERNGPVIGITGVRDDDEILMITARGKLQRIVAGDISVIGRNTQGVRIMTMDESDTLAAIVRVPRDENGAGTATPAPADSPRAEPRTPEDLRADPFDSSATPETPADEDSDE